MRNVLFITADQWRGDCLGYAGHPLVKTPHLDELAQQAVAFTRHYAGAAPCSPARACLYTGLYQMNNRVCSNGSPLDARHDNLAAAVRRAGYDPTLFGYTDQSVDPRTVAPNDPRCHSYEGILPGFTTRTQLADHESRWLGWLQRRGYTGTLKKPDIHFPESGPQDPPVKQPPAYNAEQTQSAFICGEFIDWLQEQPFIESGPGDGWFAHVSFLRPHPPFCVPEPFNSMYNIEDVPDFRGPENWEQVRDLHLFLDLQIKGQAKSKFVPGLQGLVHEWDNVALKTIAAIYYGMVSEVDSQIGRLFDALKEAAVWDDTLIIFTSDHGELLGDHHMLGKTGFHDSAFHIPLLIRDPKQGAAHGTSVEQFTEAVDVFPTLMALLQQQIPPQLDGRSLAPSLASEPLPNWRESAHWEFDFRDVQSQLAESALNLPSQLCNLCVIRDEKFKYVHFAAMPPLLFNLIDDPDESVNVAEREEYQSVRLYYAEKLLRWRAEHLDQSLALSAVGEGGLSGVLPAS